MVRISALLVTAGLGAMASAQDVGAATTSVTSLFLPGVDKQTVWASVVTAEATAATYLLACPPDADSNDCGLGTGLTVVQGPSTFSIDLAGESVTQRYGCDLVGSEARCAGSIISPVGTELFQNVAGDYTKEIQAVTITAGLEKLDVEAATITSSSTGPTETGTHTGTHTEDAAGSTSTSTAGVPQITQNAIMMGAAIVGAGAMLL
ncbi:hypothetical protein QBC40DRAFT_106549 [Triangularia verruculosa]|uniref:GPI anchored protein n=1 Tax=Triangularia verruculosa TaxID=2587418 RepID=A0AAN7AS32_9PEZI|nr:hypothetical protein QBC40DRAFT_106549 [Triangularia verruculosa]